MFGLKFRDVLPSTVADELDQLVPAIRGMFKKNHNEDGTHADVVADSLTLHGAAVGVPVDLPYDAARFFTGNSAVWTVSQANVKYLIATRVGQLVFVQWYIDGSTITVNTATDGIFIRVPEFHVLSIPGILGDEQVSNFGVGIEWQDHTGFTSGVGTVYVHGQTFANPSPSTVIHMEKVGPVNATFGSFPLSANFSVLGSAWFLVEPDNIAKPFFGV